MLKKVITYTDYNGIERTEPFYFNLSRIEVSEMEVNADSEGGYMEMVQKIIDSKNNKALWDLFKSFVLASYGEKSSDGKRFEKDEALTKAFTQTEAYVVLMTELTTKDGAAAEFINGIMPKPEK